MPKSKIDWCDYVWNPVSGCTKVSEGCKFCYAERFSKRTLKPFDQPGRKFTDIVFHEDRFRDLDNYKDGSRIFVGSVTDIFHPDIPDSFLDKLWNTFLAYSGVPLVSKLKLKKFTFIILTKRPERMIDYCNKFAPLPNVWLGVSAENQQRYNERVSILLQTRAAKRIISIEPILENITMHGLYFSEMERIEFMKRNIISPGKIDWVIVGGESGQKARLCSTEQIENIVIQCKVNKIAVFVKQIGTAWVKLGIKKFPKDRKEIIRMFGYKGNNFENFPDQLQYREFPDAKS